MTSDGVWVQAYAIFLIARDGTDFTGAINFVDDARVEYAGDERMVVVNRRDLFGLNNDACWRRFLEPVPQWLHVTLLTDDGTDAVFALTRSASEVLPGAEPVVNVAGPQPWAVELR